MSWGAMSMSREGPPGRAARGRGHEPRHTRDGRAARRMRPRSPIRAAGRRRGWSILEVLLSAFAFSLLLLFLGRAVHLAALLRGQVRQDVQRDEAVLGLRAVLDEALGQGAPVDGLGLSRGRLVEDDGAGPWSGDQALVVRGEAGYAVLAVEDGLLCRWTVDRAGQVERRPLRRAGGVRFTLARDAEGVVRGVELEARLPGEAGTVRLFTARRVAASAPAFVAPTVAPRWKESSHAR